MRTSTTDLWPQVREERTALLELLETLAPAQWDRPTLCSRWRVRDVVGHLVSNTEMRIPRAVWGLARSGFRMNTYIDRDARRRGSAPPTELLADFRAALPRATHPPGQSPLTMLEDVVIHQIDIRRPLGRRRDVPPERMRLVAGFLDGNGFYPGKKLARGLRLQATDTDWVAGDGPVIQGPIEAIVLTLSGRYVALDELGGEGLPALAERTGTQTDPALRNRP